MMVRLVQVAHEDGNTQQAAVADTATDAEHAPPVTLVGQPPGISTQVSQAVPVGDLSQ